MNSKKRTLLAMMALIVFLSLSYFTYHKLADHYPQNNSGSGSISNDIPGDNTSEEPIKATDFMVMNADGNKVHLSDFYGKPIVLNFWASWCFYCKEEMPLFEKSFQTYGNDITFLMINCTDGTNETQEIAQSFLDKMGYTFPVYYDHDGEATYVYEAMSLPTSVFIDKDGNVIGYQPGKLTEEMLQSGIDSIL